MKADKVNLKTAKEIISKLSDSIEEISQNATERDKYVLRDMNDKVRKVNIT